MINTRIAIKTSKQIIIEVEKLNNYTTTQVIIAKGSFSVTTLVGIRKYFKFSANKDKNWI
jgi:hypothetical protein